MTKHHTEIELKWELDAANYAALAERLAVLLGPPRILQQDNRFFDSADGRLRTAGLSVRVRRENESVVLTCKSKSAASGDDLHQHEEWESALPAAAWTTLDQPERLQLPLPPAWQTVLAGAALVSLGGFTNLRLEYHDGPHLLCLDRTDFSSRRDYELEIETAEPIAAATRWRALLTSWGIAWEPQLLTKLHRHLRLR